MLKDMIDKYSDTIEVPVRMNIIDVLTNENAISDIKDCFVNMTKTCQELEKFENVQKDLNTIDNLVPYLESQGYENVTIESAGEIAKDVYEKIKKSNNFFNR